MENRNQENQFRFVYSAKEQEELKRIRDKYQTPSPKTEDALTRLRRLDQSVTRKAQAAALSIGIIGALILGFGMSLIMSDLSQILGSLENMNILFGTLIGCFGGILAGMSYPIYCFVLHHQRKKVAPEVLKLTDELMK